MSIDSSPRSRPSDHSSDPKAGPAHDAQQLATRIIAQWRADRELPDAAPPSTRQILDRHPELARHESLVLDLTVEEYCLRRDRGETVDPTQFAAQFPEVRDALGGLLEYFVANETDIRSLFNQTQIQWPRAGELFLGFLVLQELGRGAVSRVYLASQLEIGQRLVVLKITPTATNEPRLLGRLQHPNIVPILSLQRQFKPNDSKHISSDPTVIVMPFLGSTTLREILDRTWRQGTRPTSTAVLLDIAREGALDEETHRSAEEPNWISLYDSYDDAVIELTIQLADALAFAHEKGVLHRDIKPSNILLTPSGVPMLMDFDVSTDAHQPDHFVAGTVPYMPPETLEQLLQKGNSRATALGKSLEPFDSFPPTIRNAQKEHFAVYSHNLSERRTGVSNDMTLGCEASNNCVQSDVFSLGAVLYELLTGVPPFGWPPAHSSLQLQASAMLTVQHTSPLVRKDDNRHLDDDIFHIIERCVAPTIPERISSPALLATRLRTYLDRQLARRSRQQSRKSRFTIATLSCALVLLLTFSTLAFQHYSKTDHFVEGLREYHDGNFTVALRHFSNAIDEFETQAVRSASAGTDKDSQRRRRSELYFARGQTLRMLGALEESCTDLERALGSHKFQSVSFCLAYVKGRLGNDADATAIYEMLLGTVGTNQNIERSLLSDSHTTATFANNLAYHYIRQNRLGHAWSLLTAARERAQSDDLLALITHNRAEASMRMVRQGFAGLEILDTVEDEIEALRVRESRNPSLEVLLARIANCRFESRRLDSDRMVAIQRVVAAISSGIDVDALGSQSDLVQYIGSVASDRAREHTSVGAMREFVVAPTTDIVAR